jgi:hypothetical protein
MPKMENIGFRLAKERNERKERINVASRSSLRVVFVDRIQRIKDAPVMEVSGNILRLHEVD